MLEFFQPIKNVLPFYCFISTLRTWSERGWCRMERMARDLLRDDGILIQVQVASRPIIVPANTGGVGSASRAPGKGHFSVESDRGRIGRLVNRLLFHKLQFFLSIGMVIFFNFLLCLVQKILFALFLVVCFVSFKTPSIKNTRCFFCHAKLDKSHF